MVAAEALQPNRYQALMDQMLHCKADLLLQWLHYIDFAAMIVTMTNCSDFAALEVVIMMPFTAAIDYKNCHMFSAKPLPNPILAYCQFNS